MSGKQKRNRTVANFADKFIDLKGMFFLSFTMYRNSLCKKAGNVQYMQLGRFGLHSGKPDTQTLIQLQVGILRSWSNRGQP
jgi:hypothetical protein